MPQKFGNRGFGAAYGSEHLAGGLIYVTSTPDEDKSIYPSTNGGFLDIIVGVKGSLIDLSTVKIFINTFVVFDGSVPEYTTRYAALSSFSFRTQDNGYLFHIKEFPRFGLINQDVTVQAAAADGEQIDMTYRIFLYPQFHGVYPPVPKNVSLGRVPIKRFSGRDESGLLDGRHGTRGKVYFSPSLKQVSAGADVDFDKVELVTDAQDHYRVKQTTNGRMMLLGPWPAVPQDRPYPPHFSPGHTPRLNHPDFRLARTKNASVVGTMTDTSTEPAGVSLDGQMRYDGSHLWFVDVPPFTLKRVDPATRSVAEVSTFPVTGQARINFDSSYVYVTGQIGCQFVGIFSKNPVALVGLIDVSLVPFSTGDAECAVSDGVGTVFVGTAGQIAKFSVANAVSSYPTPYTTFLSSASVGDIPRDLVLAYGFLWAVGNSTLMKIDPVSLTFTSAPLPNTAYGIHAAFGSIWAIGTTAVYRYDPVTLAVTIIPNNYPLLQPNMRFATDDGTDLWVSGNTGDGTVYRVRATPGSEAFLYAGTTPLHRVGTDPPHVTLSGTPNETVGFNSPAVVLKIVTPGEVEVAEFQWSIDGVTFSGNVQTEPNVILGSSGLTAHFPAGDYFTDQLYTADPVPVFTGPGQNDYNFGIAFVPGTAGPSLPGGIWVASEVGYNVDAGLRHINPSTPGTFIEAVNRFFTGTHTSVKILY